MHSLPVFKLRDVAVSNRQLFADARHCMVGNVFVKRCFQGSA